MEVFLDTIQGIWADSGFSAMTWQQGLMILISGVLIYLAIAKGYEPLLLLPIAFGMLLTNLPMGEFFHMEFFVSNEVDYGKVLHDGGLIDFLYLGVKLGIYPSLIFLGIGCMTDFGPLIANPKSFMLGAAAQLGIFTTFL
ncbi:MAG: sodium ion-translocating decarboxylase subunit beta, partial [Oscillospiraceae bacterium]